MTASIDNAERRRKWWRRGVPVAMVLLSLVAAELTLRALDREPPNSHQLDDVLGWRLRPGFAGWYTEERAVWIQINSDGWRDREHRLDADPGTVRVAVLGDSFMEALNIPIEQTFSTLLERQLDSCLRPAGRRAEVLNFGVAGYGTVQELLTFRRHVKKYRPDIVLLAIYTANDIFDNHAALQAAEDDWRPYFKLHGETLEPAAAPTLPAAPMAPLPWYQRWRLAVTERSMAARLLHGGWSWLRGGRAPAGSLEPPPGVTDEELARDTLIYPPPVGDIAEAWRITEATMRQLSLEVAAIGAEFWMTTLSNTPQVHPDVRERRAYADRIGAESLFAPDWRLRDFARTHGIPFVLLAEPLADYSQRTGEFLNGGYSAAFPAGTGHWNETAHRLAAGIVGGRMCERGLVAGGGR